MTSTTNRIASLLISLWIAKVFLLSLPYKFSGHPDTQYIFGTIGQWMGKIISPILGNFFSHYGAYIVGSVELLAAMLVVAASAIWLMGALRSNSDNTNYQRLYFFGGILSSMIMTGAAFFHLFTPLGITVIHQGQSDGGSLFYAAVSILVLGLVLAFINRPTDLK